MSRTASLTYTIPGVITGPIVCRNCYREAQPPDKYSDDTQDNLFEDFTEFIAGICKCYVDRRIQLLQGCVSIEFMRPKQLRQEQIFVKEVFERLMINLRRIKPGWLLLVQSNNDFIPEEIKRKIIIHLRNFFIENTCVHHWDASEMLIYPTLKFLE
jgi:hypothetical protein